MPSCQEVSAILNELVSHCDHLYALFNLPPHMKSPLIHGGFIRDLIILIDAGYFRNANPDAYWDIIMEHRVPVGRDGVPFLNDIDFTCIGIWKEDDLALFPEKRAQTSSQYTTQFTYSILIGRLQQPITIDICAYKGCQISVPDFTVNSLAFDYHGPPNSQALPRIYNGTQAAVKWSEDEIIEHILARQLITNTEWVCQTYLKRDRSPNPSPYSAKYYRVEKMVKRGYKITQNPAQKMSESETVLPTMQSLCTILIDLDSRHDSLKKMLTASNVPSAAPAQRIIH